MLTEPQEAAIIQSICDTCGISVSYALSKSRKEELVSCRMVIALCFRNVFGYTFQQIEKLIGLGYSSINQTMRDFSNSLEFNPYWRTRYEVSKFNCEVISEANSEPDLWFEVGKHVAQHTFNSIKTSE